MFKLLIEGSSGPQAVRMTEELYMLLYINKFYFSATARSCLYLSDVI